MDTANRSERGQVDGGPATTVVGRHIFYNNSAFDGNDPAAGAADDNAIAPGKTALLPGQTARFVNYTSYDKGINGIIIDIDGLWKPDDLDAADFAFRFDNDDEPTPWDRPPVPTIAVRQDAGIGGSDRVTLIWPDHAVTNRWLQVTVLSTPHTGLPDPDIFYFGHAIGESSNSANDARVNAIDMLIARNNPRNHQNAATIDSPYDFNRDQRVNALDMLIVRNNQTHFLNALNLISVPDNTVSALLEASTATESPLVEVDSTPLDWLYEFDLQDDTPSNGTPPSDEAIDELMQTHSS